VSRPKPATNASPIKPRGQNVTVKAQRRGSHVTQRTLGGQFGYGTCPVSCKILQQKPVCKSKTRRLQPRHSRLLSRHDEVVAQATAGTAATAFNVSCQHFHEVSFMCDDNQLEVRLLPFGIDNSAQHDRILKCPQHTRSRAVMLTHSAMAFASPSLLSRSKFVVGSSKAKMPQLRQNDSANASRITREANTWTINTIHCELG
jgi:hypothetical protein